MKTLIALLLLAGVVVAQGTWEVVNQDPMTLKWTITKETEGPKWTYKTETTEKYFRVEKFRLKQIPRDSVNGVWRISGDTLTFKQWGPHYFYPNPNNRHWKSLPDSNWPTYIPCPSTAMPLSK